MANDFVTRLTNDATQFNQSFDEATSKVEKFSDSTKKANDEIKDLGSEGVRSTKDLLKEIAKMSGAERSVSNYRRQLSQMTRDIQDLTINYNKLSESEKNSEIGKATLTRIQELTTKAGQYRDAVLDAQAAVNAMASDTANWDAAKQGIDTLSSALQGIVSSGVLGKKSTEELVGVIAKLKAMEAATNGVIKVGNALQKQSALMMGISRVQAVALTRAKELEAVATGKATIAQKLFNTVAKANPYVLLATTIITVVGALAAFTLASKKAKKEAEGVAKAQENINDAMNDSHTESGKAIAKFEVLRSQYGRLKTEAEKQTWIKKHEKEFKDLKLAIKNVNDADDVFIKKASDMVKAMRLRAEAAAIMEKYQEEYAEAYKKSLELEEGKQSSFMSSSTYRKEWKEAGLNKEDVNQNSMIMQSSAGAFSKSIYSLTESGVQKMKEYWKKKGEESMDAFNEGMSNTINLMEQKIAEAERLSGKYYSDDSGGGDKGKPERKADDGTKKALQEELSLLQTELSYIKAGTDEWKRQIEEIERVKAALEDITASEKAYSNRINGKTIESPIASKTLEGSVEYKAKIKPVMTPADLKDEYETAAKAAGELSEYVRLGVIDKAKAEQLVANMNETLASHGIKIPVELDIDDDAIETIREKMESITDAISAPINAINSVKDAFENLQSTMEDPDADGWDKFFAVFQTGEAIIGAVSTAMGIYNTIQELVNKSKAKGTQETLKNTIAEQAQIGVKGALAGASITEAAAEGAEAGAKGASSVAKIPFVGPVLAIAAIASIMAAVIAMISSAKGFATGGIVGGHSYTGDKILARLNSGEMILNSRQQDSLWKDLNENKSKIEPSYSNTINIPDKITMVAHGGDLEAVIYNTRKRISKI